MIGCDDMKFVKEHKKAMVVVGIIVLTILAIVLVKKELSINESTAIYGNRLEGRKKVEISNSTKNKVKESLSDSTNKVDVRVAGRIIYITIMANADANLESAKNLGNKSLESFSDAEKKYYDIQIMIDSEKETNQFPIIGYKSHNRSDISWTYDRAES